MPWSNFYRVGKFADLEDTQHFVRKAWWRQVGPAEIAPHRVVQAQSSLPSTRHIVRVPTSRVDPWRAHASIGRWLDAERAAAAPTVNLRGYRCRQRSHPRIEFIGRYQARTLPPCDWAARAAGQPVRNTWTGSPSGPRHWPAVRRPSGSEPWRYRPPSPSR
jgi:hypothetical protein